MPGYVVIGRDGNVLANSSIPPAEVADIAGKTCEDVTPKEENRFAEYCARRYAEAGVDVSEIASLSEADQMERYRKMSAYYMAREIKAALQSAK